MVFSRNFTFTLLFLVLCFSSLDDLEKTECSLTAVKFVITEVEQACRSYTAI